MFIWRPVIEDPPMYTQSDLNHWVTIKDVFDAHEALDLRAAFNEKSSEDKD
jgi:hypothetical protein